MPPYYRGTISDNPVWHNNGEPDAIKLINGKNPICLNGIGIFVPQEGCSIKLTIYKSNIEVTKINHIYANVPKHKDYMLNIEEKIILKPYEEVDIKLSQRNNNRVQSKKIVGGYNSLMVENIEVKIHSSKYDKNCTSVKSGAFPCFDFSIPSKKDIPEDLFCEVNFENLIYDKMLSEMPGIIAKKYNLDVLQLNEVNQVIFEFVQYGYDRECTKCKEITLRNDFNCCEGQFFKNPSSSWGTISCKNGNFICEKCICNPKTLNIIKKIEKKLEFDEEYLDCYDGGIFDEDEDPEYYLIEKQVCSSCYEENKKNNNCNLCFRVFEYHGVKYQKCKKCELKRVCRICMPNDFENNKCNFCSQEEEN